MLWVWVGWGTAAVVAVVVLGFCAFELFWKTKRLKADLDRLQSVTVGLQAMAEELGVAAQRAAAVRAPAGRTGH